jgi:hypothetical protein
MVPDIGGDMNLAEPWVVHIPTTGDHPATLAQDNPGRVPGEAEKEPPSSGSSTQTSPAFMHAM